MAGKFELKKSKNDKFFFSLLAGNGQTILSSEMYEAKASAVNGIESVKKNAAEAGRFDKLTQRSRARRGVHNPAQEPDAATSSSNNPRGGRGSPSACLPCPVEARPRRQGLRHHKPLSNRY